jgi:hypothetical protein
MGAWQDPEGYEDIVELVAGDGIGTAAIYADPGESIHFDILRNDGAANANEWRIMVNASTDPTARWSDPSIGDRRLKATQLNPNFAYTGYYAYQAWIENDAVTPIDKVGARVHWRKDNVNI